MWMLVDKNCDKQLHCGAMPTMPTTIIPTKYDFPNCPANIISILPGCIAHPFENYFVHVLPCPQKCLEEIKKAHPDLRSL